MQPEPGGSAPGLPRPSKVVLYCNCARLCGGVLRVIEDRRKWNRHAPYRAGPLEFFERRDADNLAAGVNVAAPIPPGRAMQPIVARARSVHQEAGREPSAPPGAPAQGFYPHAPDVARPPSPIARPVDIAGPLGLPDERVRHDDDPPDPIDNPEAPPPLEPIYGYTEDVGVPQQARRREVAEVQDFVRELRTATLDGSGLSAETITRLRNPRHRVVDLTPEERAAIRMYLARGDASEDNFTDNRAALLELHQEHEASFPTYDGVKRLVADVTGINPLIHDMCVNSCVAFTGPFAAADKCPKCQELRYDPHEAARGHQIARRTFHTYPLGPQLQAMYASAENTRLMHHRAEQTRKIRTQLRDDPNSIRVLDDIYWGNDYLAAVGDGRIKDDDSVVMMSLDGAQLYQSKNSDCWFFIWVLFDLPPTSRYKKRFVLPGGVIGGPKKPKNIDSFLFPCLHHVAALQREGLQIWDAAQQRQFQSDVFLYLATADGPGMAYLSGLVGHQGARGCRLYCGLLGRFKPSASTYYPAMQRADNNPHDGSNHPDFQPVDNEASSVVATRYLNNLRYVITSRSHAEYQRRRLETGIAKPSIFSGLSRLLPIPGCFGADLMHLLTLNLTDLLISLFRGTMPCDATDDRATWPWAVLRDNQVWRAHGKLVQSSTRYLPGSFDRPPRNPAEKINSGYKAWEWLLYVYGLLPGLLRGVLPPSYYLHFCKLVFGVRIMLQHSLPFTQIRDAHAALIDYVQDFEKHYYCRRLDRLHFVRQSVHALIHIAPEALRIGPGSLYTQWTLENYIGNITREIKQHTTPYANVSERALRRTRVNALQAAIPAFAPDEAPPASSVDLGGDYRLLRARDRRMYRLTFLPEQEALCQCLVAHNVQLDDGYQPAVQRWARVRLPNGQIARTAWKEGIAEERGREVRRARMIKLADNNFAEVLYYFLFDMPGVGPRGFAMISYFSRPDPEILAASHNVLLVCTRGPAHSRTIVDIHTIASVVAMIPLPPTPAELADHAHADFYSSRFFVVEKPGLEVAVIAGIAEPMGAQQDGVDNDDE